MLLSFLIVLFFTKNQINEKPPRDGAWGDNFVYAYNLAKFNKFSKSKLDNDTIVSDYKFPPFYPVLLSKIIILDENFKKNSLECYLNTNDNSNCLNDSLILLKIMNFLIFYFLVIYTYHLSKRVFKNNIKYIPPLIIVIFSWHTHIIETFQTENLSSLLFVLYFLYRTKFIENNKVKNILISSISLTLLTLTRNVFILIVFAEILYFLIFMRKNYYYILIIFIPLLIFLSYAKYINNFQKSNLAFDIRSGKIGDTLTIRAEKNLMNYKEYIGGFFYFSPVGGSFVLRTFLDDSYYKKWKREEEDSFHNTFDKKHGLIRSTLIEKKLEINDNNLFKESIRSFAEKPLKHLATSILFLYRGMWIPCIDRYSNLFGFVIFFLFYLKLICNLKNFKMILKYSPILVILLFHAIFTHYIPRYSLPLFPVIIIFGLDFFVNVFTRFINKK